MANKTKIKWYGRQYTNKLFRYVDKREERLAKKVKESVQASTPVATGALKASIKVSKQKDMEYRVSSDKPYADDVEYGTSSTPPQPYFRVGLKRVKGL